MIRAWIRVGSLAVMVGLPGVAPASGSLGTSLEDAKGLLVDGRGQAAEALLERAVKDADGDDPALPSAHLLLAGITEDAERSRDRYEEIWNRWPTAPEAEEARLEAVRFHYARGEYMTAQRELGRFYQAHPKSDRLAEAHHVMGRSEMALGRPAMAEDAFQRALLASPDGALRGWILVGLGDARVDVGRIPQARDAYGRAVEHIEETNSASETWSIAVLGLAKTLRMLGDEGRAAFWYEKVVEAGSSGAHYAEARRALNALEAMGVSATPVPAAAESTVVEVEPIVEADEAESEPKTVPEGPWTIQVGAFTELEKATALRARLLEKNHAAELATLTIGGKPFYKVYVGGYPDRGAAYMAGLALSDAEGLDFLPVER